MRFKALTVAASVFGALTFGAMTLGAVGTAQALPMSHSPVAGATQSGIELAQYRRGHRGYHRRPVCRTEITRTRGPFGRMIVRKVRTCR